jgi:SAM-dependent methyltransferase
MKPIREGVRRALGLRKPPYVSDRALRRLEHVIRMPPMTPELARAIRLISPGFDMPADEKLRRAFEANQNESCWGEYRALAPVLAALPPSPRVLELGPGLGRSLIFFAKRLGWRELHAWEGEGSSTKYTKLGPRFDDSFCGDIAALKSVLALNGVDGVAIHNARDVALADLPGPFDFIYSFYSIGFHWSVEHFLDDLVPLLADDGIMAFIVPPEFSPGPAPARFAQRMITLPVPTRKGPLNSILVLSRKPLPEAPTRARTDS